jgi:hypothetical protein
MNCLIFKTLSYRLDKLKLCPIYVDEFLENNVKTFIVFTNENKSFITPESLFNLLIENELL